MQDQPGEVRARIRVQFHVRTREVTAPLDVGNAAEDLAGVGGVPFSIVFVCLIVLTMDRVTNSEGVSRPPRTGIMHHSADLRHKRHSVVGSRSAPKKAARVIQVEAGGVAGLRLRSAPGVAALRPSYRASSPGASVPIIPSHARSRLVVECPTKQLTP